MSPTVSILDFADKIASVSPSPLLHYGVRIAIGSRKRNECGCVAIKLYLNTPGKQSGLV